MRAFARFQVWRRWRTSLPGLGRATLAAGLALSLLEAPAAWGQATSADPSGDPSADSSAGPNGDSSASPSAGFVEAWFRRVDKTQAEQPHWVTPLYTTTPRLEQEIRYDLQWQSRAHGADLTNYGVGKGLELIPLERVELIFGIPAYIVHDTRDGTEQGWADDTFLVKYRFLSANEENGNYIVTGFFGVSVPTGSDTFTAGKAIYTPTLAFGKGWGTRERGFALQSTLGVGIPGGDRARIGMPLVWNTALQAHVLDEHFWPEVEMNLTHWWDGPDDGGTQAVVTLGAIFGRFPLWGRLRLLVGAGYQLPVSAFRIYEHAWLLSVRLPF